MNTQFFTVLTMVVATSTAGFAADVEGTVPSAPIFEAAPTYNFYLGLKGGGGPFIPDSDFTAPPTAFRAQQLDGKIEYDSGYFVAVEAGYFFTPNWRAGIELSYARLEPDSLTQDLFAPFTDTLDGDIDAFSAFAEGAYEFGPIGIFRPYVKAGVGAVHISLDGITSSPTFAAGVADDEDTILAGRVGAGAAIAITDRIDFITEYDFTFGRDAEFEFSFPTFPGVAPAPFEVEVAAHRLMVGIRARF